VAGPKCADVLVPGTHGCTMGGNPLCAAAGAAAMKLIEDENLLDRAVQIGKRVADAINAAGFDFVSEIRGKGALIGIQLDDSVQAKDIMMKCMENGLIICIAKNNVLRVAPALTIEDGVLDKGLAILVDAMKE
jgi:acetylornithine/succinyldiaminopimelate/putrescine aminotransferase